MAIEAAARPSGRVEPLIPAEKQWQMQTAEWSLPGRFGFFVFRVTCDWDITDYLPGLDWYRDEDDYYVAGTVDKFDLACYSLLRTESPNDVCDLYRYIHTKLSDFNYALRGEKWTQPGGYVLK
ncbi:MAG: hypothetical protein GY906_04755 [bacterium]|nr:hypothetical protein [bacterium]